MTPKIRPSSYKTYHIDTKNKKEGSLISLIRAFRSKDRKEQTT